MKEDISNSIALRQNTINELIKLKNTIDESIDKEVKFVIETTQLGGYFDVAPFKRKDKLPVTNNTMKLVIDGLIKKEKDRIDRLIDMEVERRIKNN